MSSRPTITLEQLQQLQQTHRATIPTDYLDLMGHMNIQYYFALFNEAIWHYFSLLGMDQRYYQENHAGSFALKHHINYLAEVRAGETVAIFSRLVARSEKRIQFINFMWNESKAVLAATLEAMGTHTDMTIRRSAPFPPQIAERLDAEISKMNALAWDAPLCGILSP